MKKDLAIAIADATSSIKKNTDAFVSTVMNNYAPVDSSNEEMDSEYEMVRHLVRHELLAAQHTLIKKEFETSKRGLDDAISKRGGDAEVEDGAVTVLFDCPDISFWKRRNNGSSQIKVTNLINSLNQLGVPKKTIDAAIAEATVPTRGSVYYIIEAK